LLEELPPDAVEEVSELVLLLAADITASTAADSWAGSMLKVSRAMPLLEDVAELVELDAVASVLVVALVVVLAD
jgi:hypothetical protein